MGDITGYSKFLKVPGETFESINKINAKICKDEQEILYRLLNNKAEQKIKTYGRKINDLEKKYGMNFSAFQAKIHSKRMEENLEEWNDLVLWGGYIKAYLYWRQFCRTKGLKS